MMTLLRDFQDGFFLKMLEFPFRVLGFSRDLSGFKSSIVIAGLVILI